MSRRKRKKSLSSKDNSLTKKTSLEEAEELIKKADDILSHKQIGKSTRLNSSH